MVEEPLHVAVLRHLQHRVTERREQIKETMARGLPSGDYDKQVGAARECALLLEDIEQTLDRLKHGDLDEDNDDEDNRTEERTRRQPHRSRAG